MTGPSKEEQAAIAARQSLAKQLNRIRVFRTNVLRRDGVEIDAIAKQLEAVVHARMIEAANLARTLRREREGVS